MFFDCPQPLNQAGCDLIPLLNILLDVLNLYAGAGHDKIITTHTCSRGARWAVKASWCCFASLQTLGPKSRRRPPPTPGPTAHPLKPPPESPTHALFAFSRRRLQDVLGLDHSVELCLLAPKINTHNPYR